MAKGSPKKQDIETRLLDVDTQNFRIGDFDNAREAYRAMIEEEGADLANLGEDIVENGLSMGDLFFVCPNPDNPNHFVVLDGNRRFTAIKLMEKPVLAEGTAVHKRFQELAKAYSKKPIKKVSTVIYADKDEAMPWIRRRHQDLGGRGMSQWDAYATGRADHFGGHVRASRAAMEFVKAHGQMPAALEKVLSKRTTNLDRVLQMPYMKSALGVTIGKDGSIDFANGSEAKGLSLLLRMLRTMAQPGFNVNQIRSAGDRKDFIDTFAQHNVLEEEPSQAKGGEAKPVAKKAVAKKPAKRGVLQSERNTLALKGKDSVLPIRDHRLQELYDEACRLNPENVPNSASLLTRVFLELSTDHFLTTKKVPLPAKHAKKNRTHWREKGISLEEKIACAIDTLDPSGSDPDFRQVRQFTDRAAIHSVDALHDYMHGLKAKPNAQEVKKIWERWHVYFDRLFAALSP